MITAAIQVKYKYCDGYHVFKSDQIKELCVASKDPDVAVREVVASIKMILKLTQGIDCEVEPMKSFEEFIESGNRESESVRGGGNQEYLSDIYKVSACA